jgi:hypothetical protein
MLAYTLHLFNTSVSIFTENVAVSLFASGSGVGCCLVAFFVFGFSCSVASVNIPAVAAAACKLFLVAII